MKKNLSFFEHIKTMGYAVSLGTQCVLKSPVSELRFSEILGAIHSAGVESLPIITIATTFAGLVITDEIAWHMHEALSTVDMIPGVAGQMIIREVGIAIPAFLMVAKSGASTTAEIGSMRITEQIDALRLLGIDPVRYLVWPRLVGSIVSLSCLTLIATAVTLLCGIVGATLRYGFNPTQYLSSMAQFVGIGDVLLATLKGALFGAVIPLISCAYGMRCSKGAEGVGLATTNSVVSSSITVIILDFVLTYLFTLIPTS